jgi:protoheme IX farnesyltransferase
MLQISSASRLKALLRDYAELTKARITTLIVLTAWCGYFFGAHRAGISSWSIGLFHALLGVALVSSGTAALNEVMEASVDARMRRTAMRPLPSGRMSRAHALVVGLALTLGGSLYLSLYSNLLTGLLVFLTAEKSFSDVYVRGRIPGSYAGGAGMDGGARTD